MNENESKFRHRLIQTRMEVESAEIRYREARKLPLAGVKCSDDAGWKDICVNSTKHDIRLSRCAESSVERTAKDGTLILLERLGRTDERFQDISVDIRSNIRKLEELRRYFPVYDRHGDRRRIGISGDDVIKLLGEVDCNGDIWVAMELRAFMFIILKSLAYLIKLFESARTAYEATVGKLWCYWGLCVDVTGSPIIYSCIAQIIHETTDTGDRDYKHLHGLLWVLTGYIGLVRDYGILWERVPGLSRLKRSSLYPFCEVERIAQNSDVPVRMFRRLYVVCMLGIGVGNPYDATGISRVVCGTSDPDSSATEASRPGEVSAIVDYCAQIKREFFGRVKTVTLLHIKGNIYEVVSMKQFAGNLNLILLKIGREEEMRDGIMEQGFVAPFWPCHGGFSKDSCSLEDYRALLKDYRDAVSMEATTLERRTLSVLRTYLEKSSSPDGTSRKVVRDFCSYARRAFGSSFSYSNPQGISRVVQGIGSKRTIMEASGCVARGLLLGNLQCLGRVKRKLYGYVSLRTSAGDDEQKKEKVRFEIEALPACKMLPIGYRRLWPVVRVMFGQTCYSCDTPLTCLEVLSRIDHAEGQNFINDIMYWVEMLGYNIEVYQMNSYVGAAGYPVYGTEASNVLRYRQITGVGGEEASEEIDGEATQI